jgi:hypothetical protein
MKEVLEQLIDDFHERPLPSYRPRLESIRRVEGKANVVVGMRRTGKTWFCYQLMKELLDQGIPKERILYLNFEDERLLPFEAAHFQTILETSFRKFPSFKDSPCYFFLDEIQRIDGWDKFVRRLLDTEKLKICLTGSSATLLSTEIASSLRGRSLTTEIFPLSFPEYLRFRQIEWNPARGFGAKTRATLQNAAEGYFATGGFPEVQFLDEDLRVQILQNYVDVVILRDVIERHAVSNTVALRALIRHVMHAPAGRFSVNKFYNFLKSQGIACTKNDLYGFLDFLKDSFLFHEAPIHSRSEAVRRVNPKKIYAIDTGLLRSMSLRITEDRGALLETVVFMHLRRQGIMPEYHLSKDGEETDFVVQKTGEKGRQLIQVCWSLQDKETRERELSALFAASKELGVREKTIISWMDDETDLGGVSVVPAWKWLLSDPSIVQ